MSNDLKPKADPSEPMVYQIRIQSHLGQQWTDWFEGMTITLEDDGDTLITGPVVDQASLYGLIRKVRDLGILLLSVSRVEPGEAEAPDARHSISPIKRSENDDHQ